LTDEWYPSHDWRRDQYDEDREWRMDIIGQNGNDGEHYDVVNSPSHYKQGDVECIEAIKAALSEAEWRGYCKGNILKYTWREAHKGGDESVRKAQWYINKLLDKTR